MPFALRPVFRPVFRLLVAAGGLALVLAVSAAAQPAGPVAPADTAAAADTARAVDRSWPGEAPDGNPNTTPYETDRSVAYHVLAAPAHLLHGVTRPIGWGLKYAEREFPGLFIPRQPPRGVLPLVELGGPAGIMAGLALYDNHLFGTDQRVRLEGLYGSSDTFEGEASYQARNVLGPGSGLSVEANVFSDPNDQFFVGGNASELEADEAAFLRDQFDVASTLTLQPAPRLLTKVSALYEHTDVRSRSRQADARLGDAGLAGLRTTDLLTARVFAHVDLSRGAPRTHAGTELLVQLDYTHDLDTDRFRYGRYVAEVRQYVPLYVLPRSRRLALRLRVEQVAPLFDGRAVPFYHLPRLGGTYALRGFRYARFRDDGSLLASAEYRYPIWRQFDAVLFVDAGQVFDGLGDVAADRFHWSYGGGLHMLNRTGIAFRFELAHSAEGLRSILTVRPSFARWSR